VLSAGALDGLGSTRDESAVSHVLTHTRYGVPTRGRRAAIAALPRLSEGRKVREHLEDLLDDIDPYLRIDVVAALQSLGDPRARSALRRRLEHELDGRVARRIREALRDLGDSAERERKRLSDELETLRNEFSELKTRMSQLEGKKAAKGSALGPQRVRGSPSAPSEGKKAPTETRGDTVRSKRGKGTAPAGRERSAAHSPRRRKLLDERGTRTR
jgi:aminopeptidase N